MSLSTVEIAKIIRSDLKKEFPLVKFTVHSHSFSGGTSITVKIVEGFKGDINNPERIAAELANPHAHAQCAWLSDEAIAFLDQVKVIASKHHDDRSDSQSDYFNCNFYLSVVFASATTALDREVVTARVRMDALEAPAFVPAVSEQEAFLSSLGVL